MRIPISLLFAAALTAPACAQDLATCVGLPADSMQSNSEYQWYCLPDGGPTGGASLICGSPSEPWDTSVIETSFTGPGLLRFQWKSSCASGDWLTCEVEVPGGFMELTGISGEQDWEPMDVCIPQGRHRVRWVYHNFATENDGEDAGRLAQVSFTPYTAPSLPFELWKEANSLSDGQRTAAGQRVDTAYIMGLAAGDTLPSPVVQGGRVRWQVPISKMSGSVLRAEHRGETGGWSHYGVRSRLVPGSDTGDVIRLEYSVPASGNRHFFRAAHQTMLTPPDGFAFIPEGKFMMGSRQFETGHNWTESYRHQVTLTRPFFLKTHETTYNEWKEVEAWARVSGYPRLALWVPSGGTDTEMAHDGAPGTNRDNSGPHPVVDVSWYECAKWLNAKSELEGRQPCFYVRLKDKTVHVFRNQTLEELDPRLDAIICDWNANGWRFPTDAEWEYACRAGTETGLYNGEDVVATGLELPEDPFLGPLAWYRANSGDTTHPVGRKLPNAFGLHDMYGNAAEWTWDLMDDTLITQFQPVPVTDPRGPLNRGIERVGRGGGFRLEAKWNRSPARLDRVPVIQGGGQIGLRFCRNAE